MDNIWTHIFVLIPLEFGLLHGTPLGGILAGWFQTLFAEMGFEFAKAAAHGAVDLHANCLHGALAAPTSVMPPPPPVIAPAPPVAAPVIKPPLPTMTL